MNLSYIPLSLGSFVALLVLKPVSRAEPVRPAPQLETTVGAPEEIRLKKRGNGHFYAYGLVDGQVVEFLVDTGATNVVLTVDDARRVGLDVDPTRFRVIGSGAAGPVRGQVVRPGEIEISGRVIRGLDVIVAQGLEQSLLGQDFLRHMPSVTMGGDMMVMR